MDEAYEEAAFLKTNRFLAAYVVDEQNRASYVNDHLNESFVHVRDSPGSTQFFFLNDYRRSMLSAAHIIGLLPVKNMPKTVMYQVFFWARYCSEAVMLPSQGKTRRY